MGGSIYDISQYGKPISSYGLQAPSNLTDVSSSLSGFNPGVTTNTSGITDYSLLARSNGGGSMLGGDSGFGMNMGTAGMGLQGLATIGGIWNAYQSQKLAKEQFAFTKAMANTNLNNQIKSYNTALSDRSRTRGAMEGQSAAQVQSYIDTNQMTR